jgi:hypothetical protein
MNQYLFLRRMRGPIILLVFGITAILDEYAGIGYARSWPLYLIAWGLLKLAENAILAQNPPDQWAQQQYPGYQPAGYQTPGGTAAGMPGGTAAAATPAEGTPIENEERR